MTEFYQIVSMLRLFETLERRVFRYPTLRNLTDKGIAPIRSRPQVPCMGLLRFSLFEAVIDQSYIKLEPLIFNS